MAHPNEKTSPNTPHGETGGGDRDDKRRGGLERQDTHDTRIRFVSQVRETSRDVFEERVLVGMGAELVVEGAKGSKRVEEVEDGDEGHEVEEDMGVGQGDIDEERVVRELLGVGAEVVVEGVEDGNGGHEVGLGATVDENEVDEERAVRELLGVTVEEQELEREESEVVALLLEFDQPGDEDEARWLTASLGRLSLTVSPRGTTPLLYAAVDYVPLHGAAIENATGSINNDDAMDVDSLERDEDAMDVDTPERDENAMDVDNIPFL